MKAIVDEIKKIVKEKEYDLNAFESVFDSISNLEEIKAQNTEEQKKLKKEKEETEEKLKKIEKEKEELNAEYEKEKQKLIDLKLKYIERFDNSSKEDDDKNKTNENITIKDLFKEG